MVRWAFCCALLLSAAVFAAGESPHDPLPFNIAAGPLAITLPSNGERWLSVSFAPGSTVSHLALETEGSLDTILAVYSNLEAALDDEPMADDDDSGPGLNASLGAPLGFVSPYLLRVTAWGGTAGSTQVRGQLTFVPSDRCDWPAGCPLATVAQGEPTASEALTMLRAVRSEVLSQSPRGRDLAAFYWRLAPRLIPAVWGDKALRHQLYQQVVSLLPLAREAVQTARGVGGRATFSASDLHELEALLERILPLVSAELASELEGQWRTFDLSLYVGQPLADVLAGTGLLPLGDRPRTVILKLRSEPERKAADQDELASGDADLDQLLSSAGVATLRRIHSDTAAHRAAGLTRTVTFEVQGNAAARALAARLAAHPAVEWARVAGELRALAADPYRGDLWGLDAIRAPQAWNLTLGKCSSPVAVIDTGIKVEVADLTGRTLLPRGYDFADDDPDPDDGHGHGTHVAGTVAAALGNSISVAGVAPATCVIPIKVLGDDGSGEEDDVAAGIVHAADIGASVINLSLGCDCEVQPAIEEALEYAAGKDVVIVAAAGNDGFDHLLYPASSVWTTLAVGAVDENLELADFSNYGPGLDLVAPGVDVVSTFPDGESCMGSGTSMATPHVAGAAALVRAIDPRMPNDDVGALLKARARDLGAPGPDERFGAGLVNARAAVLATDPCRTQECLELRQGRFQVRVDWRDFEGKVGTGHVVPQGSDDSGLLWFFQASNWEMLVKVLDGCPLNGHFWVLAAATTNVQYTLHVTDKRTGTTESYFNPLGVASPAIIDTTAFASCAANGGVESAADSEGFRQPIGERDDESDVVPAAACGGGPDALCLNQQRFRVEATWRDFNGNRGIGRGVPGGSDDSGLLWFFQESNWEMLVKVLDGCAVNGHYWVLAAATTNVEYNLRLTDTATGRPREYRNALGTASPAIIDTFAFSCAP